MAITEYHSLNIILANYKLQELWTELDRIGDYELKIIEFLASNAVKGMNNKWFDTEVSNIPPTPPPDQTIDQECS